MARRDGSSEKRDAEEVLSAEELDIAADEHVATLGSGRFVVGSDGPPNEDKVQQVRAQLADAAPSTADLDDSREPTTAVDSASQPDAEATSDPPQDSTDTAEQHDTPESSGGQASRHGSGSRSTSGLSGREVKNWVDTQLQESESQYAYRIAAKSGERVSHQQLASDDIGMAFDALLMWYAQQVGRGTAVEEVLGILLAESNIRVQYPTPRLLAYLDENDLGPNDSIADLIRAVQDDDGLVFPPTQRNHE